MNDLKTLSVPAHRHREKESALHHRDRCLHQLLPISMHTLSSPWNKEVGTIGRDEEKEKETKGTKWYLTIVTSQIFRSVSLCISFVCLSIRFFLDGAFSFLIILFAKAESSFPKGRLFYLMSE